MGESHNVLKPYLNSYPHPFSKGLYVTNLISQNQTRIYSVSFFYQLNCFEGVLYSCFISFPFQFIMSVAKQNLLTLFLYFLSYFFAHNVLCLLTILYHLYLHKSYLFFIIWFKLPLPLTHSNSNLSLFCNPRIFIVYTSHSTQKFYHLLQIFLLTAFHMQVFQLSNFEYDFFFLI